MSDLGETFNAWSEDKQQKRAQNRADSAALLRKAGATFTAHNAGAHLIVHHPQGHVVDFWPGTGKWTTRGYRFTLTSRGVHNLIRHLQEPLP